MSGDENPAMFSSNVGLLESEYYIQIDLLTKLQPTPHCVPVVFHEQLQMTKRSDSVGHYSSSNSAHTLDQIVPKNDRQLHLFLDPQCLNKAIQRDHFP